jgi:hypothetical protein
MHNQVNILKKMFRSVQNVVEVLCLLIPEIVIPLNIYNSFCCWWCVLVCMVWSAPIHERNLTDAKQNGTDYMSNLQVKMAATGYCILLRSWMSIS